MLNCARFGYALILAALLTGCSTGTALDDVDTLWGGGETTEERETRERLETARANKVPVQAVSTVEIGRTGSGILITAYGVAPGAGYSLPLLRVRRDGVPASDGYIEFDFVASAPAIELNLGQGNPRSRALRADLPVDLAGLQSARGLRVLALNGGFQVDF